MTYNLPLTSLKSQTRDPQLKIPPGGLVLRIFTSYYNYYNNITLHNFLLVILLPLVC